jgi:hypothetical protein
MKNLFKTHKKKHGVHKSTLALAYVNDFFFCSVGTWYIYIEKKNCDFILKMENMRNLL